MCYALIELLFFWLVIMKNVELPPIIEGDEPIAHPVSNSQLPQGHLQGIHEDISTNVMEEIPSSFVNEERALILYKPLNTPPLMQPQNLSNLSVKVNANLVPRFQGNISICVSLFATVRCLSLYK